MKKLVEKVHNLKTTHPSFKDMWWGMKNFELRKNDRDYKVGDRLILEEYDESTRRYLGKELIVRVTYILKHNQYPGLEEGYIIMGFARLEQIKRLPRIDTKTIKK